jgi:chemotaxis protein methyltransferase CheR
VLTIERAALEGLSALLLERAGLRVAADGFHGLRLALQERMPALGLTDAEEYVRRLRAPGGEPELRSLLPLVTVTHTEFFRDPRQFGALERRLLPEALARARRDHRQVRLWSAGCATGEEPFSLAMLLEECGASPAEVDLWATDLNQAAVESARQGRYSRRRAAQVGPARLERFFRPAGEGYQVIPSLRARVRFEGLNLAAPGPGQVEPESFDVILCRNVIIYFDLATIRRLMDRFFSALRPGGFLVLGYSESLFRVYDRFEMVEVEGAFLYRRPRTEAPAPRRPPAPRVTGEFPVVVPVRPPVAAAAPPVAAPRAPRVAAPTPASVSPERRQAPQVRLAEAARMTQEGQFEEAARALQHLLRDEPHELSARLALGNVWSVMGRAQEAQRVFDEVFEDEPFCVEARVYGAMAQMQVGRFAQAHGELGKALFLEPTLALAHYLAAQVSERLGDREGARRAYRNAIAQLRFPQRALAGFYPDMPDSAELISRAARYALSALEEA